MSFTKENIENKAMLVCLNYLEENNVLFELCSQYSLKVYSPAIVGHIMYYPTTGKACHPQSDRDKTLSTHALVKHLKEIEAN